MYGQLRPRSLVTTIVLLLLLLAAVYCLGWSRRDWMRNEYRSIRRPSYVSSLEDLRLRTPGGWFIVFSLPQGIPSSQIRITLDGHPFVPKWFDMDCPADERRGPIVLVTAERVEGTVDLGEAGFFRFMAERQTEDGGSGLKRCFVDFLRDSEGAVKMRVISGYGPQM